MSLPKNTIRISFDLDLTDFPAVRPDTREDIHASLQNLGAWLHNLSTYYATDAFSWSAKQSEMSEVIWLDRFSIIIKSKGQWRMAPDLFILIQSQIIKNH